MVFHQIAHPKLPFEAFVSFRARTGSSITPPDQAPMEPMDHGLFGRSSFWTWTWQPGLLADWSTCGDRFLGVIRNHKRNWPIERHSVFLTHSSDNRKRHMRVMVSDSPLLGWWMIQYALWNLGSLTHIDEAGYTRIKQMPRIPLIFWLTQMIPWVVLGLVMLQPQPHLLRFCFAWPQHSGKHGAKPTPEIPRVLPSGKPTVPWKMTLWTGKSGKSSIKGRWFP